MIDQTWEAVALSILDRLEEHYKYDSGLQQQLEE